MERDRSLLNYEQLTMYKWLIFNLKQIYGGGLGYITNRIVANIPFHCLRLNFYKYFLRCQIGEGSHIFMEAWFDTKGNFKIGKNSTINQKCRLDNRGSITIGDNVSISAEVCILTADHDLQRNDFSGRISPIVIEDYVFIGTRAIILRGVTLGRGSGVAAGAVVTKSVAPFTIVAGVPAKPIGTRPTDLNYTARYPRLFS